MNDNLDQDEAAVTKRGAKPVLIGIGAAALVGAIIAAAALNQTGPVAPTPEQVAKDKVKIGVMPLAERMAEYRKWAAPERDVHSRQEAFAQLAWEKDAEGLKSIIEGVKSKEHAIRGTAAMALVEYGTPTADAAKSPLLEALKDADASDKPQICWALTVLKESQAFDPCLVEYKLGHLSTVMRLDQNRAFDPEVFASLVSLDKLAALAGDDTPGLRQLVAIALSSNGDPKWITVLTKLVDDKTVEVAREAAVGLGRIANEASIQPLLSALAKADKDSREKILEALQNGVGTKGLVLALKTVSKAPEEEKPQTRAIFKLIEQLQDPRGGDALYGYIKTNPKPAWKVQAALRLAEIGDVRAADTLGWRLEQDTLKLYDGKEFPREHAEGTAKDAERVTAARYLADLAILNHDKLPELRKAAEEGALNWSDPGRPGGRLYPHANALRFLSHVKSAAALPKLKAWADPNAPFPKDGVLQFPPEWEVPQSALRYLGATKDPSAWSVLEKQIKRRPQKVNASWESLEQGGQTVLGMVLRSLGAGASQGFAEWGDPKAYPILVKHIEDPHEQEQSRIEACSAVAWVATEENMAEVLKKATDTSKTDKSANFLRACYLEALVQRAFPAGADAHIAMMTSPKSDLETRHQAARALGKSGLSKAIAEKLFAKVKDTDARADAALAILLGADSDLAVRTIGTFNDANPEALGELKDVYNRTFSYWSDRNFESGDVARWVRNANAIARVKVHGNFQDWAGAIVSRNLVEATIIDNGPHSLTRTQLRVRLVRDAKGTDVVKRDAAVMMLKFTKERGALMALRHEPGALGEIAKRAFFEVLNPKAISDSMPDAPRGRDGAEAAGPTIRQVPPR